MRFNKIFLWALIASFSLCVLTPSIAEKSVVPVLDKTTIPQAAHNGINKCKGADGSVAYTQFACPEHFELVGDHWQENSNLTINHQTPSDLVSLSPFAHKASKDQTASSLPFNLEDILDPDGTLNLKEISPAQILQQGIKAMMMRNSILEDI